MKPILQEIPERIETERLIIRCPQAGDAAEYHTAMTETFDEIKAWFGPWAKEPFTLESVERMITEAQVEYLQRQTLTLICILKNTNTIVGRAFISRINWEVPKGMLGYWTRNDYQKSGIGREVIGALRDFCFSQLSFQRLELYIDPRNTISKKFFESCGFQMEGRIRNYGYDNFGTMRDYLVYSMLPAEFEGLKKVEAAGTAASNTPEAQLTVG